MIKIYNLLPDAKKFLEEIKNNKKRGALSLFNKHYFKPNQKILRPLFDDIKKLEGKKTSWLKNFNLIKARKRLLKLKQWGYPQRASNTIKKVEKFYGKKLNGNLVLFFAFNLMDGYCRFDKGKNTIYLGLDFEEADKDYLDILLAHELNHLTRDSHEVILKSYGANFKMSHDEYIKKVSCEEHLISEGLAGYFSSVVFPRRRPWQYLYYSEKQYQWCVKNQAKVNQLVKKCLEADYHWGALYRENLAGDDAPERLQYYFSFELIKKAAKKYPLQKLTFMAAQKIISEFL